jgi:hypothetical protein
MNDTFYDFFKSQGVELSVEWGTVLRKIKATTDYDIFGDNWDTQLDLLTSIINEYGFTPFEGYKIDSEIYEDCLLLIIYTKQFTIHIEPDYIQFYGDNFDIKVSSVDDLKMFFSKVNLCKI